MRQSIFTAVEFAKVATVITNASKKAFGRFFLNEKQCVKDILEKWSSVEQNYRKVVLEALAIFFAVERF